MDQSSFEDEMSWENCDPAVFTDVPGMSPSNSVISLASSASPLPPRNYLYPRKEFVEELRPEEIRWFYKKKNEKKWNAFIGYDSLRIECKYRELSYGAHVTEYNVEMVLVRGGLYEVDVASKTCFPVYWSDDINEVLRGTWFHDVTWQPLEDTFANIIETEHIQNFCGRRLDDQPEIPKKGPRPILHNKRFTDFYVDWNGPDEMYMFSESASSRLMRQVSQSLGFQKSGTRLRRGYCYEAVMDDKPADITHLVFVVHGIGQKIHTSSIVKCCKSLRETVNDVKARQFPHLTGSTERSEFLPVEWRTNLRLDGETVDAITPQKMKSFRTLVNSSAMDVLYYTSPLYRSEIIHGLRSELNRLYLMFCERNPYFVPRDGKLSIIAHSLGSVIVYDILTDWNPIHVYDQFLSSVIDEEMENAAGCQELLNQLDTARSRVKELESLLIAIHNKQQQHAPPLNFQSPHIPHCSQEYGADFYKMGRNKQIENLFCLGSPLAVFLALRGHQPPETTCNNILDTTICSRIYNIYHPADPVAYRMEPLVLKRYMSIPPVLIERFDTSKVVVNTTDKSLTQQGSVEDAAFGAVENSDEKAGESSVTQPKFSWASVISRLSRGKLADIGDASGRGEPAAKTRSNGELRRGLSLDHDRYQADGKKPCIDLVDLTPTDSCDIAYRVDHQLRESNFENRYLSTITSHTSYWTNHDVASFILHRLHPDVVKESIGHAVL